MRSVKIGLAFAMLAALPVIWVAGCTADGGAGGEETDSGTSSGDNGGSSSGIAVPDSSTDPVDARADTGKPDAKADAALDAAKEAEAGPKAPEPGDSCATPGTVFQRGCGACGTQEAVCEANNKVSDYSFCAGEVAGGCTPGATRSAPCGKCGTRNEVCQNNCTWAVGACGGEPPQACTPLEEKYITAGCSAPSTFRKQVCQNNCQYGPPSPLPCFELPPDITISAAIDGEETFNGMLSAATDRIPSLKVSSPYNCPVTLTSTLTSYAYTVMKNPTAQTAKVEIYYTAPAGGTNIDTITAVYPGAPPKTDAERIACQGKVNDICSASPCTTSWSGLVGADAVTLAPGAVVVIYTAAYFATDTGPFVLHVKTKSLL